MEGKSCVVKSIRHDIPYLLVWFINLAIILEVFILVHGDTFKDLKQMHIVFYFRIHVES